MRLSGVSESRGYRYLVLFALLLVYTLNYVDRQIIGILAQPIKAELELTDTALGVMGGLAFAIFYTTLGVPIARLADRANRKHIVAVALTLWSSFTVLCGFATGFWSLFLARLGVGVGEAGGTAPSWSMVADYFPPHQRARAMAVMTLAVPMGSAIGLFVGGFLAVHYGWRAAFIIVGLAGIVVAPLFILVVREPVRGGLDEGPPSPPQPSLGAAFAILRGKRSFWLIALASSTGSMLTYGLQFWLPAFMQRSLGLDLSDTSRFLGALAMTAGVAGILLGGFLGDRLGQRDRRAYVRVPGVAMLFAFPLMLAALSVGNLWLVFILLMIPQAIGLIWPAPSIAVIQNLVPASMRATALAIYLLVANMVGLGLGTLVFGALSDSLAAAYGEASLRYAIIICTAVLYPLTSILFLAAGSTIERDWHRAED